ncbi:putative aristolochene synthase [Nemania sp. FL0031]|nr:putative aristolochene synthase [Nemania sp. FL0031]
MSFDEGRVFNEKVILFCRGDTIPDRNIPIEWITWDLWESLRACDRKLADGILEAYIGWLEAQTDPRRLQRLDLKEYLEYREIDVGHKITCATIRFCMALSISPEELSITRSIEENCSKHVTVSNDIWSFEKEVLAAQSGHPEGGVLLSAVSILSDTAGISTEASKRALCGLCREWELVHEQLVKGVFDATQNKAMTDYLKALELGVCGHEAWAKRAVRYSVTGI